MRRGSAGNPEGHADGLKLVSRCSCKRGNSGGPGLAEQLTGRASLE